MCALMLRLRGICGVYVFTPGSHDSSILGFIAGGAHVLTFSNIYRFKRHQIAHLSKVLTFEKPGLRPEDEALMSLRRGGGSWAII
jgi:hypothetical protein